MVSGACEPNDIKRLLKAFDSGVAASRSRPISPPTEITRSGTQFVNIWRSGVSRRHKIVSGFRLHQKSLRQKARAELLSGSVVSLYIFSRTALFHRVRFHPDGFWEQSGGLFGRANRSNVSVRSDSYFLGFPGFQRFARLRTSSLSLSVSG